MCKNATELKNKIKDLFLKIDFIKLVLKKGTSIKIKVKVSKFFEQHPAHMWTHITQIICMHSAYKQTVPLLQDCQLLLCVFCYLTCRTQSSVERDSDVTDTSVCRFGLNRISLNCLRGATHRHQP